jgi:hypothetical protein
MSFGTILDNISGKSCTSPGSYSIVVTAAVDPETKIVKVPLIILLSFTIFDNCIVMSMMSPSPFECS